MPKTDRPDRVAKKPIVAYVHPDVWEEVRFLAVRQRSTTQQIITDAVHDYLKKAREDIGRKHDEIAAKKSSKRLA